MSGILGVNVLYQLVFLERFLIKPMCTNEKKGGLF